jgi:hypothetical protein
LKNEALETIAVNEIAGLVDAGLITATEGTKIKITPLGKQALQKEGRLDQ